MKDRNIVDDCIKFYNTKIYPALFTDIERAPFWPVITAASIIYLISSEVYSGSLDKIARGENIRDDIDHAINKINLNHEVAEWRRVLLISIFLSIIILFLFTQKFPDGFDFFLIIFIIFTILYPISNLFGHYWYKSKDVINKEKLLHLRNNIVDTEIKEEIKKSHVYYDGYPEITSHIDSILSSIISSSVM